MSSSNASSSNNTDASDAFVPSSVLIIGATGRTGTECILALHKATSVHPELKIHAFCRSPAKMSPEAKKLCTSIVVGDARKASDIERIMRTTKTDTVVVCVGNGDNVGKSDLRTESALSLVKVMEQAEFQHVHAVIVSSSGAGTSKIIVGMGIGALISYHLRHILRDHSGQEEAFLSSKNVAKRTTIVRPTSLTNDMAIGSIVEHGDKDKPPSIKTDRADLANWITNEMFVLRCLDKHRIVNITGVKQ